MAVRLEGRRAAVLAVAPRSVGSNLPEPVYVSPTLWLTDFVIAANLQADYDARVAANGGVSPEGLYMFFRSTYHSMAFDEGG